MNRLDSYVSRKYSEYFEQLKAVANISDISFASQLGEAVKFYIENKKDDLINEEWEDILSKCKPEKLVEYNTLINQVNNKIMKLLCRKRN